MHLTKTKLMLGAAVMLILVGSINRWVTASRSSATDMHQTLSRPLAEIPMQLGRYIGKDIPLETEIIKAAGVDSFIQRSYLDPVSRQRVLLYIGYWGKENIGMGHGPEVCYPAVGWETDQAPRNRMVTFDRESGQVVGKMSIHRFTRVDVGGIDCRLVGFMAVIDGQYLPKSKDVFWHRPTSQAGQGHFLAHVQVAVSVDDENWSEAEANIVEFVDMLSSELAQCWPYETPVTQARPIA